MLPIRDLCVTAFCVCPLFLRQKIIINFATFCYVVFTLITRWRHHRLLKTTHNFAQLRTTVDFIVLSIKLVFMVLGVSYSRVLITINSMILYFKHIIHIDDFPLNGHPPSNLTIHTKLTIYKNISGRKRKDYCTRHDFGFDGQWKFHSTVEDGEAVECRSLQGWRRDEENRCRSHINDRGPATLFSANSTTR